MSKETLTVELESGLIERVRRYSAEHGKDVAGTISELIASLPRGDAAASGTAPAVAGPAAGHEDEEEWVRNLPPLTRGLLGIASADVGEEDYKEYLWQKYGR